MNDNNRSPLLELPVEVFVAVVDGNLGGADLVALCATHPSIVCKLVTLRRLDFRCYKRINVAIRFLRQFQGLLELNLSFCKIALLRNARPNFTNICLPILHRSVSLRA